MAKILIVDDSQELLELFSLALSKNNHVRTASNIAAAEKQLLHGVVPDIVFIDVNLENEDGRQFCHALSLEYALPLVLISGDPEKLDNYTRFGAIAVLEKPFNGEQVEAMIRAVVEK
ncbi:response regulator [Ferruginibacter sp. HRS2-29]|uniref:response regulator n=1 Tax=Ferruginibacter sp. HRS2-29 TaxID=2487334 RepID=UPI0020CC003A|nr:response regulator [Ferruginibacter sp. HRS2-29]MCP9750565.1 response regulator [Ferruginibacter sp. HRS2-29]